MKRGVYIGPIQHLVGQGALLRDIDIPGEVIAQFDNRTLRRLNPEPLDVDGQVLHVDYLPDDALGFDWHLFNAKEFAVYEPVIEEQPA
jgi:hypothetical protein